MKPIQARVHVAQGRIRSVEPLFGAVEIITENDHHSYPGGWLLPGLVDSHAHLLGLGSRLTGLSLYDAADAEDCVERARRHGDYLGDWLVGMGWNQELWPSKQYPHARLLDEAFPDTPVCLRRADGHAAWVNSAALAIAGITDKTKDPAGGRIVRDERHRAIGILVDTAMNLVQKHIPAPSEEQNRKMILAATQECSRLGFTEIHDMDVHPNFLPLYRDLAEKGTLPVRVQSYVSGQNDEWLIDRLLPAGGEFLRVYAVKLFADGALGSRGALLLDPYSDAPSTHGLALLGEEQLEEKVRTIIEFGWNVAIHAIGDAANRMVLNTYTAMRKKGIADDQVVLRVEHAQIVHPDDQSAFGKYGIIPAVQAVHCVSDAPMAEQRLGDRRSYAYPWRSLRNNGAILAGGSDFPIESADPLLGIDAFCRRVPFGQTVAWNPAECLTRDEALDAYTCWAHEASDMSYRRGRLKPNYDADFVVHDTNLLMCADGDVTTTRVLATYTAGVRRYTSPGEAQQ